MAAARPWKRRDLERVAHIVGDSSGAAKALAEFDRRKADGEDVQIYEMIDGSWSGFVVGPPLDLIVG